MTTPFVRHPEALAEAIGQITAAVPPGGRLGVDTEFHAERRYVAALMLVQVSVPDGRAWVFDARAIALAPLAEVLAERDWVVHGGRADVALLQAHYGVVPRALWDVQVLAGLLGHGFPRRLEDLVDEVLGEQPPPGATLTDWSKRPLSARQLTYAAYDAEVVHRLADALRNKATPERLRWWREASAEVVSEALRPPDPNAAWLRLEIAPLLGDRTRARLHAMCAWREQVARERDQPPGSIVPNGVLLDVARRGPQSVRELAENRRLAGGIIRRHGQTLVSLAKKAQIGEAPPQPSQSLRMRAALLRAWAIAQEDRSDISEKLLLPSVQLFSLAEGGVSVWSGWRREAAGESLQSFLLGEQVLGPSGLTKPPPLPDKG
jgi:ribonuclease D